jgi:hypothetical protein
MNDQGLSAVLPWTWLNNLFYLIILHNTNNKIQLHIYTIYTYLYSYYTITSLSPRTQIWKIYKFTNIKSFLYICIDKFTIITFSIRLMAPWNIKEDLLLEILFIFWIVWGQLVFWMDTDNGWNPPLTPGSSPFWGVQSGRIPQADIFQFRWPLPVLVQKWQFQCRVLIFMLLKSWK